ncbi:MAG: hypothetical protein M3401_15650 [Actinomycetota bacterium]|nr:hypothetical protein [Actinomycetota bacterium]
MAPPRSATWEQNLPLRLRFERAARAAYPNMRCTTVGHRRYARVAYIVRVPVAEHAPRLTELHFRRTSAEPALTRIYADGPIESPHRYAPHPKDRRQRPSLCIWYPSDSPDLRWVPSDGLLSLIEMTRIHLYKEAYWRETGEWLGEEVPHNQRALAKAC